MERKGLFLSLAWNEKGYGTQFSLFRKWTGSGALILRNLVDYFIVG